MHSSDVIVVFASDVAFNEDGCPLIRLLLPPCEGSYVLDSVVCLYVSRIK